MPLNTREFDFALTFEFRDSSIDPDIYSDALYEAGCDDTSVRYNSRTKKKIW